MAEGKEKLEIEDIKDPEDLDIEEAVSEDDSSEKKEAKKAEEKHLEAAEEKNPTEDEDDDVLEKAVGESKDVDVVSNLHVEEEKKPEKLGKIKSKGSKNRSWLKYFLIVLAVALVIGGGALAAMYFLQDKDTNTETENTSTEVVQDVVAEEEETTEDKYLYIYSEVGLNMRQEPNTKAKVLAIIPFGYKITVLGEQDEWVKTEYDSQTGWVALEYTSATDPLVYENENYGFGFTFKASWAGYKFIEANNSGSATVKTYYVALPTTDKKWSEPGLPAGYASLFVMGVYTKAEWTSMAGGEMLPAKLGEGKKYVYTYLPAQAYATDLKLQYNEIKDIIKTFEVLN